MPPLILTFCSNIFTFILFVLLLNTDTGRNFIILIAADKNSFMREKKLHQSNECNKVVSNILGKLSFLLICKYTQCKILKSK